MGIRNCRATAASWASSSRSMTWLGVARKEAGELIVDRLAAKTGRDPYRLRRDFLRGDRSRAVPAKVAEAGAWGRAMPAGTAQGIAFHAEYKSVSAALVEIDCRPETVNRPIRDGVTGPRVTKAVFAVDVGLAVNPRGLEAQMMGGVMDGTSEQPGGAGELAVAASTAAVACAYGRATGTMPTSFPINHGTLSFTPKPTVPPIPPSPADGLDHAR
ncbi:hypothetical protein B0I32_11437 [Nonomuraea fuscirosea]|uniref:Molybdopterin-binding aldehyde dehydrogenase-like protein n=1 Tax=Nonomuraea fuscirosea TaxID=1291556 RepID=A0A2T0MST5_9ACTN|nr:hypothetical protein B0I32_11437 [Nonomuraea fuscirosea]